MLLGALMYLSVAPQAYRKGGWTNAAVLVYLAAAAASHALLAAHTATREFYLRWRDAFFAAQ